MGLLVGVFGTSEMSASLVEDHNIDAIYLEGTVIYPERPRREVF